MATWKVTTTRHVRQHGRFVCSYCQFSSDVEALGEGIGSTKTGQPYDREVQRQVSETAVDAARRDAKGLIELVPCPRCSRRSRSSVVWHAVSATVWVAVFLGAGYWLATTHIFDSDSFMSVARYVAALAVSAFGVYVFVQYMRDYGRATRDVRFL